VVGERSVESADVRRRDRGAHRRVWPWRVEQRTNCDERRLPPTNALGATSAATGFRARTRWSPAGPNRSRSIVW